MNAQIISSTYTPAMENYSVIINALKLEFPS